MTISPDRYYPAGKADWLSDLAAAWNAEDPAIQAVVHGSCDPHLVGVRAVSRNRPADVAALTGFVDGAVAAGMDLFSRMAAAAFPASNNLRDVG